MQWSLFLLLLMGPCSFFAFRNYEYHFIDQEMSWDEARKFCRENYTDLAVVNDEADMTRLRESTDTQKQSTKQGEAWIGLYSESGETQIMWSKILPKPKCNKLKLRGGHNQFCELMNRICKCEDVKSNRFLCYKEGNPPTKCYSIDTDTTWPEAQTYCRRNYTDLGKEVSQLDYTKFTSQTGSGQLDLCVNGVSGSHMISQLSSNQCLFISLFRDNWKWTNGSKLSFRYWGSDSMLTDPNGKLCAVTMLDKVGKWKTANCGDKKPFFCYDEKVILIKEEKTWEEALAYCRKNYMDLVSITDPQQQKLVQKRAKKASTPHIWLGLRYSCTLDMWFWVSDQLVCYKKWGHNRKFEECDMAGTIVRDELIWESQWKNTPFNFICAVKQGLK